MLPRKYIWNKNQKQVDIDRIAKATGINKIISSILYRRGITSVEEITKFLSPTKEQFYDPYLLMDMNVAVDRIVASISRNERITIYGDYDVDGITSTSILFMFLSKINANVDYYIPDRLTEGYGINEAALRSIRESGTSLLISVDTGITAITECRIAKEIGLDVIITDHHECQGELPDAFAIINPKRPDCNYPYKMLAGVGVTFKLISALAKVCDKTEDLLEYIDLVAVGTIADIVPLLDENRVIAYLGLRKIMNTNNIGLRELLKVSGYDFQKKISARYIGFMVGPRINAGGRMGDAKRGVELFTIKDTNDAFLLASNMDDENKTRQAREQEIQQEAIDIIENSEELKLSKIMVVSSSNWHHGIIGIVSSRIKDMYYKPNIILTIEDGIASGSARSVENFNLFKALESCKDILIRFGGHEAAAGLKLDATNIPELQRRLNEYADANMTAETLVPKLTIDDEVEISDLDINIVESLSQLEPYGQAMQEANFAISGNIEDIKAIGQDGNTLRINISKKGQKITAIGFKMGFFEPFFKKGNLVDIAGNLSINEYNGKKSIQLMLKDIKMKDVNEHDYNELDFLILNNKLMDYMQNCGISIIKEDCISCFKLLKGLEERGINTFSINNVFTYNNKDDLFKIMAVFEIFSELGIMNYVSSLPFVEFSINQGVRVQLADSKYFGKVLK
jgi:single-stranded-DNA-specific exonuclease